MNPRLLADLGRSQRLRIVNRLKRTQDGLSVRELAAALEMSYMGVKQHCIELERQGYLDTFRRPKPVGQLGRPEMAYRLTHQAHELFPISGNQTTLELLASAAALFGAAAPEKLLFHFFQRLARDYSARLKGVDLGDRVKWLARLRDADGYLSEVEGDGKELRIVEHHSPMMQLLEAYPALLGRLEQELFAKVLKARVVREAHFTAGLYRCVFKIQ